MTITFKPGDRIKLLSMPDDPDPIPAGTTGTVIEVTEGPLGQITVTWDNRRRSLFLVPGVDEFEIVGFTDLVDTSVGCPECGNRAMDLLEWDDDFTTVTCHLCGKSYEP